jgi:hypothetical protein
MLPRNVLYYGREDPLPERRILRAGPLTAVFEDGNLRYIRFGAREVLRHVYAAVRDRNWGTAPAAVSGLKIDDGRSRFTISYDALYRLRDIEFTARITITGEKDGSIVWTFAGKALTAFLKNRIGFCVLHPVAECAGRPCSVRKIDGELVQGRFPLDIAPHQPFLDFRGIVHEVLPGLRATVLFEGDVFEMEDHRNWTDASYKTYSTPLRLPFPVEVKAGTEIRQKVILRLSGKPDRAPESPDPVVRLAIAPGSDSRLPKLGLELPSHGNGPGELEVRRLKALRLSHFRAGIDFSRGRHEAVLDFARRHAAALHLPAELAITLSARPDEDLAALASALNHSPLPVARVLVFKDKEPASNASWVSLARRHLAPILPGAAFIGGTNAYFTELNRNRPDPAPLDGVCFSVNPQVHAFDNGSLAENAAAQADVVRSARKLFPGKTVHVTPVTLKPRFNPAATGPEPPPAPGELPRQVDPRQMSLFGAGWTLASLKYLAEAGADSVTYYETTGWRGVMETAQGSPLPRLFQSLPGAVFPLWFVLEAAAAFSGGEVLPSVSRRPLDVEILVLRKVGMMRVLIANLTPDAQTITLSTRGLPRAMKFRSLDESNVERAMLDPEWLLAAKPYALEVTGAWLSMELAPFGLLQLDSAHEAAAQPK